MSEVAIEASSLSKLYQIGGRKGSLFQGFSIQNIFNKKTEISNQFWALKDISFKINCGEVVGVIGKNGAGKSTLLKIVSNITRPTSGKLDIYYRIASLLEVGTGFHPELSGRENIFLNGTILGMSRHEVSRRFDEIVEFSGISQFIDTPVKRYSSGMSVRLAFAVAAHLDPEILIIDEVLAVGDAEFQKKCLGKMSEVSQKEGRTVLFVSHNMQVISGLCSRAMYFDKGKLAFEGNTGDTISTYLSNKAYASHSDNLKLKELPIDPDFRYDSILITQAGENKEFIMNGLSVEIEIVYTVKTKIIGLQLGFDLLDNSYMRIFRSFSSEKLENNSQNAPITVMPGSYKAFARIPENILLAGKYFINISASIFGMRMLEPSEGIEIMLNVVETGNYLRSIYSSSFQGMITIPVQWESTKL